MVSLLRLSSFSSLTLGHVNLASKTLLQLSQSFALFWRRRVGVKRATRLPSGVQ